MNLDGYNFYDLNTKINHKFSSKDQVFLSGYFGEDKYYSYSDWTTDKLNSNYKSDLAWGNNSISLRWNHIFKNSMFVNTTLAVTNYNYFLSSKSTNYDLKQGVESRRDIFKYTSGIRDYIFKIDLNYYLSLSHNVKFGIDITQHKFKPGNIFEENYIREPDTNVIHKNGANFVFTANQDIIYPIQSHPYIQDDYTVSSNLKINVGLHTSIYYLNKLDKYVFYEPRLSMRYLFNNKLAFKSSYAKVSQFMFLLSNNSVGMPTDLWVSAYKNIKPQKSQQISLGFDYAPSNKYFLSLESYFKPMNNLAEYKEGTGLTERINWYDKITQGKGTAYGIAFFVEKKQGKFSGWMGYTLAWSNRQFKELNNGDSFHSKYDRRHDISIVANYKKSEKLSYTSRTIPPVFYFTFGLHFLHTGTMASDFGVSVTPSA